MRSLPARRRGVGILSIASAAPAMFWGAANSAIPALLDRSNAEGDVVDGVLMRPGLVHRFGAHSFDEGPEDSRWRMLLASGCRLGNELRDAWEVLQIRAGAPLSEPLSCPVEGAGARCTKLQREILNQCEAFEHGELDHAFLGLQPHDVLRRAWLHCGGFSSVWVSSWPDAVARTSNREWIEITTNFLGLPSPAAAGVVGEVIGTGAQRRVRPRVDPYGDALMSTNLPGDGWAKYRHDPLLDEIIDCAHHAGVAASSDVVGLFRGCVAGRAWADLLRRYDSARARRGLVPDIAATVAWSGEDADQERLLELKTIQPGPTRYPATLTRRCEAVARRARGIPGDYKAKCQRLDTELGLRQEAQPGPFEQRLNCWPDVIPLVVGAYGEVNDEFLELVRCLARAGAARQLRHLHAPSEAAARGCLGWLYRRRLGFTSLRGLARVRFHALQFVGDDGSARARRCRDRATRRSLDKFASHAAWRTWNARGRADFGVAHGAGH